MIGRVGSAGLNTIHFRADGTEKVKMVNFFRR